MTVGENPLNILILAAGLGTRMRSDRAKVLHRLDGRPLIDHVCQTAVLLTPGKIYFVVGHQAEEVKQSFGNTLHSLPSRPVKFTLYFISGTDELTDESKVDLQRVFDELKQRPVPDIAVIGHTDTVGDNLTNDALSTQRAATVKTFLVAIGIGADRIQVSGRGEREPVVPTADNVDEPLNRRVEINVR